VGLLVWGGHSCPPLLILTFCSRAAAILAGNIQTRIKVKGKIKGKRKSKSKAADKSVRPTHYLPDMHGGISILAGPVSGP
jgi:hypothetical protein